jgi:hypothetical protein
MDARSDEPATKKDLDLVKQDLIAKIDVNNEAISKTLTREEYKKDYNELLRGQDEMMVVLLRIDQEKVATNARIDRVERDVERLKAG